MCRVSNSVAVLLDIICNILQLDRAVWCGCGWCKCGCFPRCTPRPKWRRKPPKRIDRENCKPTGRHQWCGWDLIHNPIPIIPRTPTEGSGQDKSNSKTQFLLFLLCFLAAGVPHRGIGQHGGNRGILHGTLSCRSIHKANGTTLDFSKLYWRMFRMTAFWAKGLNCELN